MFRQIVVRLDDNGAVEVYLVALNVRLMKLDLTFTLINFEDDADSIPRSKSISSVVVWQRTEGVWFL